MSPPVRSSAAMPAQSVAFRKEDEGLGSSLIGVMSTLVVLLVLAWLGVLYARRKGWLDRWAVARPAAVPGDGIQVLQTVRLSPRTSVFRLRQGQQEFAVIESPVQIEVKSLPQEGKPHAE